MCFASSIVEAHKKLFIAPHLDSTTIRRDLSNKNNKKRHTNSRSCSINSYNNNNKNNIEMSRSKSRLQTEVCGDCGASDPSWASINRGILLCADCCSVHRSLGRHISIIKSLRQGTWEPSVLNFVNSLNAHGANSVWEHHLLDGTNGGGGTVKGTPRLRKPNAKDALHPNKSDFIKAKHVNLSFVLKPNFQDDDAVIGGSLEQELSKQLHASVRTSNLETSLRLLVQGADPNYFHEEKRSTPLHVAAKFGQASQIELLIVYGADINAIDGNGLTPLEVARANNHNTIGERLTDVLYDVTDRIIMFLGGKKPDHTTGRHLIIPEASSNADISEQLKIARGRLQLVPNKMFEELVMDLYDEVDRRENEAIWATSAINADNVAVPFLPANPFLSATRNQGRQKLARFSRAEFAGLLTDVLIDARRRQNMANLRPLDANSKSGGSAYYSPNTTTSSYNASNNEHDPNLSDDEPIYDPVASDDDYAPVPAMAQQASGTNENGHIELSYLRKQINEYVSEINQLKTVVQKLSCENTELKSKFSSGSMPQSMAASSASVYDEPLRIDLVGNESEHELHSLPEGMNTVSAASSSSSSANNSNQSTIKRPASMYERRLAQAKVNAELAAAVPRTTTSMYQMAAAAAAANDKQAPAFGEEVKHRTDMVTRRLKELFVAMQESTVHRDAPLLPCAERLRLAVLELIAIFTAPTNCSDTVRETLKQLTRYNSHIQHECENLHNALNSEDQADIEKYVKELRECVYYIASAVKTILMQFE